MPLRKNWKRSVARSLVLEAKTETAVGMSSTRSPVIAPAESPVNTPARSPVHELARSPVHELARSPVIVLAPRSPVNAPARSPVHELALAHQLPSHLLQSTSDSISHSEEITCQKSTDLLYPMSYHASTSIADCTNIANSDHRNNALHYSVTAQETYGTSLFRSVIHGSCHQADTRFPIFSRGSQCTINALCALIYSKYSQLTSTEMLDEVLEIGDRTYRNVLNKLKL